MRRAKEPQGAPNTPTQNLAMAAMASVQLPIDRNTGRRQSDPLDVITADNWPDYIVQVDEILGYEIEVSPLVDMAARVRAALRRWAVKQ